ncbi:MAG: portal protein [Marinobacterium sp.]|nr:portal protein [Marinobacterium sp.]
MSRIFDRLFPGASSSDQHLSPVGVQMGTTAAVTTDLGSDNLPPSMHNTVGTDEMIIKQMPTDRLKKYETLTLMARDPTIDSGLKMHITHALAADQATGNVISIDSARGDSEDPILEDLRTTFTKLINEEIQRWVYPAALFGWNPLRVYGQKGVGVELVRNDYYTHPRFTRRYERAGQLAGFSSDHQTGTKGKIGKVELMPPWTFTEIRLPNLSQPLVVEPVRHAGDVFDIANERWQQEGFIESADYGQGLIETAYEPWVDLQDAIQSLKMSRRNASVIDRLIGVNTGRLSPPKAAEYLRTIGESLKKTAEAQAARDLKKSKIKTTWNSMYPIFGTGSGQVDINTLEGDPNIAHIEDVKFHINRLGSAIGIDPSLLGFGDALSGGLGDGGFFRLSVMAAMKAQAIRVAAHDMIDRLFEIHVAYKYGKVYRDSDKPWRILFNSMSTAIAREAAEERDNAATFATTVTSLLQLIDPELNNVNKDRYGNWLFTELLKMPEDQAKELLKSIDAGKDSAGADKGQEGSGVITEGVDTMTPADVRAMVYATITEFMDDVT